MLSTPKENNQKLKPLTQLYPENIIYSAIFITSFLLFILFCWGFLSSPPLVAVENSKQYRNLPVKWELGLH